mmetsp:Transcript_6374/g.7326  ORF Transcript_6374/g.7326 Transcript_6374/m.7326 type:complete len:81 (-) Transcript_6374:818-1060(-)
MEKDMIKVKAKLSNNNLGLPTLDSDDEETNDSASNNLHSTSAKLKRDWYHKTKKVKCLTMPATIDTNVSEKYKITDEYIF